MKTLFPQSDQPTMLAALTRIGDDAGFAPAGGDTMLSTPIGASVQDGPRMTTPHFGSKKAAPFVKGGGRSKTHPNDAKGRKRAAAKAALAKKASKAKDYSNTDLAFRASEPRGKDGRWVGYGSPHTYVPEKGARGPAEFKYLQAKNALAQAVLSDNDRAVKKAQKKVGEAHIAFLQEKGRGESEALAALDASPTSTSTTSKALGDTDKIARKAKRAAALAAFRKSFNAVSDAMGG